jgi:hypothetical protein
VSKLRESARGQVCLVRLPGVCNHDTEKTVLAHLGGAGVGRKQPDLLGAFCCSDCHANIDGAVKSMFNKEYLQLAFLEGMVRTQQYWLKNGLVKIN